MIHGKFFEVKPVIQKWYPEGIYFYYFCGGRGIGKSYSAYDLCREIGTGEFSFGDNVDADKFLYLRRTGVEAESVTSPEGNAFKKYNHDEGYEINAEYSRKLGFGTWYLDSDRTEIIGYSAAVSTFSNLRGVDFSDVQFILFDECIPETKYKGVIKREGILLLNIYETINRNRELLGMPPCVLVMLSNPIDLSSVLLSELGFTEIISSMIFKNQQKYTDKKRHLHIEKLTNHIISTEKRNTALYEFAKGTGFDEEALSGDFVNNDLSLVQKNVNLSEYTPLLSLEKVACVYKHKSQDLYHISQVVNPAKYEFRVVEREKLRDVFYWKYKLLIVDRLVTFDNYNTKVIFESMINYKPLIQ